MLIHGLWWRSRVELMSTCQQPFSLADLFCMAGWQLQAVSVVLVIAASVYNAAWRRILVRWYVREWKKKNVIVGILSPCIEGLSPSWLCVNYTVCDCSFFFFFQSGQRFSFSKRLRCILLCDVPILFWKILSVNSPSWINLFPADSTVIVYSHHASLIRLRAHLLANKYPSLLITNIGRALIELHPVGFCCWESKYVGVV